MEQLVTSDFKLGIIAGGQLGKMLALAASQWDVQTYILDSHANCPASTVCTRFVQGDYADSRTVYKFGQLVDMVTFEIEHVNVEALQKLKREGRRIYPDPDVLAFIQDKAKQKRFFFHHGIPSSAFALYETRERILDAIEHGALQIPFVQKTRTAGYDGKGVAIVRCSDDLADLLDGPSIVEDLVDVDKELAVIVARNHQGDTACFAPVEMVFHANAHLVEMLISPAQIPMAIEREATTLARRVAMASGVCGLLAVEMFLDHSGRVWVNEVAPRPHNSGHHTIESAVTSQYEQHLRAILGFPLGSTGLKQPAVMINLLGMRQHQGKVRYEGLTESMRIPGAKIHIYGKKETWPFRKMGHVTIVAPTVEQAREQASVVNRMIKVKSWNNQE